VRVEAGHSDFFAQDALCDAFPEGFRGASTLSISRQNVTDWTGGQQPGFRSLNYVLKGFYRNKSGPRTPRPPGGPPFLGMLARRDCL
jgi:hypothetical protein